MFDRIAPSYDLLNRLLSLRRDVAWRRRLARLLPEGDGLRVLDLATGTGDVLLALLTARRPAARGVGLDPAAGMLERAASKLAARHLEHRAMLVRGDGARLAFRDASFDAVTIAFGIRNVADVPAVLAEMRRVLRPGGRALILEFSLPRQTAVRGAYLLYFRHVLPTLGGWFSGDAAAYRYLNRSVEAFPHGDAFCALMREAGFRAVRAHPLTFGIATIYQGET